MTRTLTPQEVMQNAIEYYMSDVYTTMPGVVVRKNDGLNGMSVDVQPSLNMRNIDGDVSVARPSILNVPLHMPVTDQGGVTFPITEGCPVLLVFSMRGLDRWKAGMGDPDTPTDMRTFDIQDCVAIPGAFPPGASPNNPGKRTNPHSTDDVVLVHNIGKGSEVEIRLKPNGDVFINTPTQITVNATNAATVNTRVATVNAADSLTVDSPISTFTGAVTVEGLLTYVAGMRGSGGDTTAVIQGRIDVTDDVTANGISLVGHKHGGVTSGGDESDVPVH